MPCLTRFEIATDTQPVVPKLAGCRTVRLQVASRARLQVRPSPSIRRTLMASKAARARHEGYLLCEPANRYSKPAVAWVSHVSGDYTARDFSSMRVTPRDAPSTDVGTELDEAPSSKVIEVELQAILQANSMSRARHCCTTPSFVEPLLPISYRKCSKISLIRRNAEVLAHVRRSTPKSRCSTRR